MKQLIYLFVLLSFVSCASKAPSSNNIAVSIDSVIQLTNPRTFNGVVYIQKAGKLIYTKAFGYANISQRVPLKEMDQFSTMSIAKQITATLIMREVEKGTIHLNVPIRQYLPDLKYKWADSITAHQLLNHTSGLSSDALTDSLKFSPGLAFAYSNVAYSLVGNILEKQSGKNFETLVSDLFRLCKMKNSFYPNEAQTEKLTKGHTVKKDGSNILNEKVSFPKDYYYGSHLIVTAEDLALWNEHLHNGKLLQPDTYSQMIQYTISATHPLFGKNPIGYGYGLRINDKAAIKEIGHTGFHPDEGFTAVNIYFPQSQTSVIVLENVANENFEIAYYFEQAIRQIVLDSGILK